MPDIQLIPTDDLIIEILNRFDHSVFTGMRVGLHGGDCYTARRWKGNKATCSGLCSQAQYMINKVADDTEEKLENLP